MVHDARARDATGTPIAGIGVSAGGVPALSAFLEHLPVTSGLACVVVGSGLDEPPDRMLELLRERGRRPAVLVKDGLPIEADQLFFLPAEQTLAAVDDRLRTSSDEAVLHPAPIDRLFRTLADARGPRAAGVVLAGRGSDGGLGLRRIQECEGLTLAQNPEEEEEVAMLRAAIRIGAVDQVLGVAELGPALRRFMSSEVASKLLEAFAAGPSGERTPLEAVLDEVRDRTGNDFSGLDRTAVMRRLARRLRVVGVEALEEYLELLRDDPREADELDRCLLTRSTRFFPDPATFAALESPLLPELIRRKRQGQTIRFWVTRCQTGEEAYSYAILLFELFERLGRDPDFQVFASDACRPVIESASAGLYPQGVVVDIDERRLRRHFVQEADGCHRVSRALRDRVVFATQDLLRDPPFARVDLISAGAVLADLTLSARRTVLHRFHFALNPGGYLAITPPKDRLARSFRRLFRGTGPEGRVFCRRPSAHGTGGGAGFTDRFRMPQARGRAPREGGEAGREGGRPLSHARKGGDPVGRDAVARGATQAQREDDVSAGSSPEQEVDRLRERLRTMREEHDAAVARYRVANEQLRSIVEENEIVAGNLRVADEELRSVNQELRAANEDKERTIRRLDELNSDLRNLVSATDISTIFLDRDLRLRWFTPSVTRVFGCRPEDVGSRLSDLESRLEYPELEADMHRAMTGLERIERDVPASDGWWFMIRIAPYRASDGRVSGVVITLVDTTERKRSELEREHLLDEVRKANAAKSDFLDALSHEFRTPLNGIVGYLELLTQGVAGDLAEGQVDLVQRIQVAVGQIVGMIEEVLAFAQLSHQAIPVHHVSQDPAALAGEVVDILGGVAREQKTHLRLELGDDLPTLHTDAVKLRQILLNLLGNALKFTPEGSVTLRVEPEGSEIVFQVEDTGIGMSREVQERIFDRFWQAEGGQRRPVGMGLGLTVSRQLVELLGGEISVESEPGRGSRFTVRLPVELHEHQEA